MTIERRAFGNSNYATTEVVITPKLQLRDEDAQIVVRWGRSRKLWFGSENKGGWCEMNKAEMTELRDALNEALT